jgi:GTP-binding protein
MKNDLSLRTIVLFGKENSGKSTLFNALTGTKNALTSSIAGMTTDLRYGSFSYHHFNYCIVDTNGFVSSSTNKQNLSACDQADLIYFILDHNQSLIDEDLELIRLFQRKKIPILFIQNKADLSTHLIETFGIPLCQVSALNKVGLENLKEMTSNILPPSFQATQIQKSIRGKITILGQQNAGKSTFYNTLLGYNRSFVSHIPGTTTDSVETEMIYEDSTYYIYDTAGIKQKKKINDEKSFLSIQDSFSKGSDTDVFILLIDVSLFKVNKQDLRLLNFFFHMRGRKGIIVMNKIDLLTSYQLSSLKNSLEGKLSSQAYGKIYFISAYNTHQIKQIFEEVVRLTYPLKINTKDIQLWLHEARKIIPAKFTVKLKFATLSSGEPLILFLHGKRVNLLPKNYQQYLINNFKNRFGISRYPLQLFFKEN